MSLRARRTITARKALTAELQKHGIPVAELLDAHHCNLVAKLLQQRARELQIAEEQLAALQPRPEELVAANIRRMRHAVHLDPPSDKERIRLITAVWKAVDPLNLVQGAVTRAAHHSKCVMHAKLQQPPPLRDIFAVCFSAMPCDTCMKW